MSRPAPRLQQRDAAPIALHDRAMDNLRYIRETMEMSASFTHLSGIGGVVMGSLAFTASALTWGETDSIRWLLTWLVTAAASLTVAIAALILKSRAKGAKLLNGSGRKFALNMIPPLAAGAVLTLVLLQYGVMQLLPGVWLLLYGTSVVTGGSYSVRVVPVMGSLFMLLGVAALLSPVTWGNAYMAVGFGGLHIVFGAIIWRKHGG